VCGGNGSRPTGPLERYDPALPYVPLAKVGLSSSPCAAALDGGELARGACSPLEATGARIFAHVAPVSCQDLLADASARPGRPKTAAKVVVASATLFDPVSIPHDIENRRGSDENRPGTESTSQRRFPTFAAGHGIGPAQPLKVETRVRTPLGTTPPDPRNTGRSDSRKPVCPTRTRLTLTDSARRVRRKAGRRPCGRSPPRRPTRRCPGGRSRAS